MSESNKKKINNKSDRDELGPKDDKPTLDLIIKNGLKRKCFEEGYLPEIGWEDDSLEYFNLKGLNKVRFKMLSVITGENGTGKSSLLKLLRQKIVKVYNNPLPNYVVRYLSNGEISDNYDPEEHKHPLLNVKTIEKKCKNLIDYKCKTLNEDLNSKQKREIEKIISRCEDKFGKILFEENCKKLKSDQKSDEIEYFFEKLKKYTKD